MRNDGKGKLKRLLAFLTAVSSAFALSATALPTSLTAYAEEAENLELPTGGVTEVSMEKASASDLDDAVFYSDGNESYALVTGASADGGDDYGYGLLTTAQKSAYDAVENAVKGFADSTDYSGTDLTSAFSIAVTISGVTAADMYKAYASFLYDNPQYYWLDGGFSYVQSSGSLAVMMKVYSYYYRAADRLASDTAISNVAKTWYNSLKSETDEYIVAMELHDLIIEKVNYTYSSGTIPESACWAHNIDGVLGGKGAVCESYAKTYHFMLNLLGIDNVYIVGIGGTGAHAWNSVKIDDKYYLVDVTWDDFNCSTYGAAGCYDYFCIQNSLFDNKHTPYTSSGNTLSNWLYNLPTFADTTDLVYYYKYKSIAASTLTASNAATFVETAKDNAKGDYIYYVAPSTSAMSTIMNELGTSGTIVSSTYGYLYVAENITINTPATSITLTPTTKTLALGESVQLTATLSTGSDDRIVWTVSNDKVAYITGRGNSVLVSTRRNGTVTVKATARSGNVSAECEIISGTGVLDAADYTIWAGGGKDYKSVKVDTTLAATSYTNAKGKLTSGKLCYVITTEDTTISFDTTTHKILTKSVATYASVTAAGVVTAKKPGKAYVYACDTGSCTSEGFIVDIKQAPTKIALSFAAGSTDKALAATKASVAAGESTDKIYIVPIVSNSTVDEEANYTVALTKSAQDSFASVSAVQEDADGNLFFTVTGKAIDTSKSTPSAPKVGITITNIESGKKVSCNVTVYSPVSDITVASDGNSLESKGDKCTLTLTLTTPSGSEKTTDKAKLYISAGITTAPGSGIFAYTAGATVKGKINGNTVELSAGANAGVAAEIYIGYTDSVNKRTVLYKLATVDKTGAVTTA